MATLFICYKNTVNIEKTILNGVVGSNSSNFLDKIKNNDQLFLYCKNHIWAELSVSSEGFHDSDNRIWDNDIYPYRFNVQTTKVFEKPISLEVLGINEILRDIYGKHWSFKVLFTPKELPEQVVESLKIGLATVQTIDQSKYTEFFKEHKLFGLRGKKLILEREKLNKEK